MSHRLEIGVYDASGDGVVSLAAAALPFTDPPGDATLFLTVDGHEWIADDWNLGPLATLVPQLEAAATRLVEGSPALVRSGVEDADQVPYLLFEPDGEAVAITMAFITDEPFYADYPIDREPGMAARLYGYLAAHRDRLEIAWGPVRFPRTALLVALREQTALGRRVAADAGTPVVAVPSPVRRPAPVLPLPRGNRIDQRSLVDIPAGRIRLGLTPEEADRLADELARMEAELRRDRPTLGWDDFDVDDTRRRRREWLDTAVGGPELEVAAFRIDCYPVTNGQWVDYMKETGAAAPRTWSGGAAPEAPSHFVTGISWSEAAAYAAHHGLALPSEAEWERAARNGRSFFTWGDAYFPQGRLAFRDPVHASWKVGSRPELASIHGVHDLLGNFGEPCADRFAPYPGSDPALFESHFPAWHDQRVIRGGYDVHQDSTCVFRGGIGESERLRLLKFRCVVRG